MDSTHFFSLLLSDKLNLATFTFDRTSAITRWVVENLDEDFLEALAKYHGVPAVWWHIHDDDIVRFLKPLFVTLTCCYFYQLQQCACQLLVGEKRQRYFQIQEKLLEQWEVFQNHPVVQERFSIICQRFPSRDVVTERILSFWCQRLQYWTNLEFSLANTRHSENDLRLYRKEKELFFSFIQWLTNRFR